MEHMEKRKRNSETAGAAAQGGTPAGSRKHAAEPQGRRMERGAVAPGSAWALVTGAGSGIGRCYALRLAALGYRLVIAGDNRAPLEAGRRDANRRRRLPKLRGNPGLKRTGTGRSQPVVRSKASAAERSAATGQRRP